MIKAKDFDQANIENLTGLWREMGCSLVGSLHSSLFSSLDPSANPATFASLDSSAIPTTFQISKSWPNRCWLDWGANWDLASFSESLAELPQRATIPLWLLEQVDQSEFKKALTDRGFSLLLTQTAMYLDLKKPRVVPTESLETQEVATASDIENWTEVASRSFGYAIDKKIVQKIASNGQARLFIAMVGGQVAATALLFKTGDTIGIHQVGVLPDYRGQGLAKALMQSLLETCAHWGGKCVTLQASSAGLGLYQKLGFTGQFRIESYQKPTKAK